MDVLYRMRTISTDEALKIRRAKQKVGSVKGETLYIDSLNLIITLEVLLSHGTLIKGMDGTIRDRKSQFLSRCSCI